MPRGARISEIAVDRRIGSLEAYGFHGLEIMECLAERRAGGETGVRSVQTLTGDKIWNAARTAALTPVCSKRPYRDAAITLPVPRGNGRELHLEGDLVNPVVVLVNYRDGLRGTLLYADNLGEWTAAWREADTDKVESTLFWTQEARPFMHFTYLLKGIEQMMITGKPAWPVERTLLTTGILNAFFRSKAGWRAADRDILARYSLPLRPRLATTADSPRPTDSRAIGQRDVTHPAADLRAGCGRPKSKLASPRRSFHEIGAAAPVASASAKAAISWRCPLSWLPSRVRLVRPVLARRHAAEIIDDGDATRTDHFDPLLRKRLVAPRKIGDTRDRAVGMPQCDKTLVIVDGVAAGRRWTRQRHARAAIRPGTSPDRCRDTPRR